MISRFATSIGGALVSGALALASSSSAARPGKLVAAPAQQQECGLAGDDFRQAAAELRAELAALASRAGEEKALFAADAAVVSAELKQALADAQDEARQEVSWFSVSDETPGWLGIRMEEVGSAKSKELKLPAERGALVTQVSEDSPAAKAGLKVNDVITEFDGQRVESTMALQRMVRETPAGRTVSLNVWRDGHSQTLNVELASRRSAAKRGGDVFFWTPDENDMDMHIAPVPPIPAMPAIPPVPAIQIGPMGRMRMFGGPVLGVDAEDLSGQLGQYFGAPDGEGVLVREVMPGTAAEKAGLKAGDVILRVDGKRVRTSEDLHEALAQKTSKAAGADSDKAPTTNADLSVLRAGKEIVVRVELQSPQRKIRSGRRVAV